MHSSEKVAAVVRKTNDCVRHFCGQAEALSIWCVATFHGASVALYVLVAWYFIMFFSFWGLSDLANQREFELTTCSENLLYESLSSGNTPLVKKVSCGVEFCRVWSPVVRAGAGLVEVTKGGICSDGTVPTDLRGCSGKEV